MAECRATLLRAMRNLLVTTMLAATAAPAPAAITLVYAGSIPLGASMYPTQVAAADIDGNSTIDFVVSCRDVEGRILIVRGLSGGGFAAPEPLVIGAQTDWVEIRDLDGDSIVDLLVSIRAGRGRLAILRGLGGGAFAAPIEFAASRNPAGLVAADFDADGDQDAALVNWGCGSIEVWGNQGALVFSRSQSLLLQPWATAIPYPFSIAVADVEGDGDLDLVAASIGTRSIAVLRNDGKGVFSRPRSWVAPAVDGESIAIANLITADIDLDGDQDLVTNGLLVTSAQRTVIWRNDGNGGFAEKTVTAGVPQGSAWSVAAADLDADGDSDLLMGSALPGNLTVAEVDGAGGGAFVEVRTLFGGGFTRAITPVDFDRDGDVDVVTVDISSQAIFLYRNVAGGLAGEGDPQIPPANTPPHSARVDAAARTEWLARWVVSEGGIAGTIPTACGAGAGLCEEPHATPGCVRTLCCEAVCEFNPLCCEVAWDQACVDAEDELCDSFNCPSAGACSEAHIGPGCEDEACCGFLCEFDPFCCDSTWDEICAHEANDYYGLAACEFVPDPSVVELGEHCYERLSEACNTPGTGAVATSCNVTFQSSLSSDAPRDTDWYWIELLDCGRLRVSLETECPIQGLALKGPCDGPLEVIAEISLLPCTQGTLDLGALRPDWFVVSAANASRPFRSGFPCDEIDPDDPPPGPDDPPFVPGYFGLDYRVKFGSMPIYGDINGDGRVDGVDMTALLSGWGQAGPADLDGNGIVDGLDLTALMSNWT